MCNRYETWPTFILVELISCCFSAVLLTASFSKKEREDEGLRKSAFTQSHSLHFELKTRESRASLAHIASFLLHIQAQHSFSLNCSYYFFGCLPYFCLSNWTLPRYQFKQDGATLAVGVFLCCVCTCRLWRMMWRSYVYKVGIRRNLSVTDSSGELWRVQEVTCGGAGETSVCLGAFPYHPSWAGWCQGQDDSPSPSLLLFYLLRILHTNEHQVSSKSWSFWRWEFVYFFFLPVWLFLHSI